MTKSEVAAMLKAQEKARQDELSEARTSILKMKNDGQVAPLLEDTDIDFLAQTKVKLSQRDILKMYVGNWA